jgi:PII-like signaling protein
VTPWRIPLELGCGVEGYGHDQRTHSARFFDLVDEPVLVVIVVTEEQKTQLLAHIETAGVGLFHVAQPVEFGFTPTP